jgi:beta-propeller repeat-containing protein
MLTGTRSIRLVLFALFVLGGIPTAAVARSHPFSSAPRVDYASYWGGTGGEGCEPTPAADGSLYVTCGTESPNLPRVGAIQSYQGQEDGYIAKLDRTGKHILYATYLGSPGQDEIDSAAVDARGNLYVSGFAAEGFPTTSGAYDPTFNGAADCCGGLLGDAFVAKLSADGSRLEYSTFIGGSGAEAAPALALDHDRSVVIVGKTGSADFPTTAGAVESTFQGGTGTYDDVPVDAFAAKLNPSGSGLVYSTYLGGSEDDVGNSVAVDDAGNAYYAGFTASPEFQTTRGALKTSLAPAAILNGFVTKLDRTGRLKWSSYLGGDGQDSAWGIGVDSSRHVYVSGSTIGGFPVTANAAQLAFGGVRDWFVAKLDRSGSSLDWATYLGGSQYDGIGPTLRVDQRGNADVVGPTASTDFPITRNAFQAANAGGFDLGIVQLDRNGRLLLSSYLGGSGDDDNGASGPGLDQQGNFYVSGVTSSPNFPVTTGAIQPTYGGGDIDGLLAKVAFPRSSRMDAHRPVRSASGTSSTGAAQAAPDGDISSATR